MRRSSHSYMAGFPPNISPPPGGPPGGAPPPPSGGSPPSMGGGSPLAALASKGGGSGGSLLQLILTFLAGAGLPASIKSVTELLSKMGAKGGKPGMPPPGAGAPPPGGAPAALSQLGQR